MSDNLQDLLKSADEAEAQGDVEAALRLLRVAASRPEAPAEPWFRLGRLLADLGQVPEALKALEGALHRDPAHLGALDLLVGVAPLADGHDLALQALDRAREAQVPDAVLRPLRHLVHRAASEPLPEADILPEPPDLEVLPEDADLVRFLAFFGGREDVYARQWYSSGRDRGGYSPVHEPLTPSVLRRHFLGEVTLGVYPVRLDGTCVFAAVDLDIPPPVLDAARADASLARRVATRLQQATAEARSLLSDFGFTVIVEDSGYKGRHLWLPLDSPVPARLLRDLGTGVERVLRGVVDRDLLTVETFPKQAEVRGKGLGNLIKLPLGIHRRSGRRSAFLDADLSPIRRPFTYLRSLTRAPASVVVRAIEALAARLAPGGPSAPPGPQDAPGLREPPPEPADLLPAPPAPPPTWTEADFQSDPDVRHLLAACPVLADLVRQALEHDTLSREARLVLRHTLGHFPSGLLAYNFLHDRTGGAPQDRLVSQLRGNPVSCAKVRSRLPDVAARVPCACEFPWASDTYPHPVLHLSDPARPPAPLPAERPAPDAILDIEAEVRRFTHLVRRLADLERDRDALARRLALTLRALPDACVTLAEGTLRLVVESGIEVLDFEPAAADTALPIPPREAPIEPVPAFRVAAPRVAASSGTASLDAPAKEPA